MSMSMSTSQACKIAIESKSLPMPRCDAMSARTLEEWRRIASNVNEIAINAKSKPLFANGVQVQNSSMRNARDMAIDIGFVPRTYM